MYYKLFLVLLILKSLFITIRPIQQLCFLLFCILSLILSVLKQPGLRFLNKKKSTKAEDIMNEWTNMPINKMFKENKVVEGLYLDHGTTNFFHSNLFKF